MHIDPGTDLLLILPNATACRAQNICLCRKVVSDHYVSPDLHSESDICHNPGLNLYRISHVIARLQSFESWPPQDHAVASGLI